MLLEEQLKDEVNIILWKICEEFRNETNIKVNYIEYISLLLYIKFSKENIFKRLYIERTNYYISKYIDNEMDNVRKEINDNTLFINIKFSNISVYRRIGEESVISKTIEKIQKLVNYIEERTSNSKKIIANSYEYILMKAASNNEVITKGEFYTPKGITKLLTNILDIREGSSIYDPACGSGNFLINAAKNKELEIVGEEGDLTNYNLCVTNFFLHDVKKGNINFGLTEYANNRNKKYDYVLTNPPYAEKNWEGKYIDDSEMSFFMKYNMYGVSIGDYAYVLHSLNSLNEHGKMAILLPRGVLFRETEKRIRERLVLENKIEAVIGLPENLFFNTRIPVVILVMCKNRNKEEVMFIDASNEYKSKKNINILTQENQDKILDTLKNKKEIEGFSYIATKEKIMENNYNLTIKKYVTKKFERNIIQKQKVLADIEKLEREQGILEENIKDVLEKLGYEELLTVKKEKNINYNIDYVLIGNKIKKERIKKKYTQEQMAERMDISVAFYSRIERGLSGIRLERIVEICNILNIEIQNIL